MPFSWRARAALAAPILFFCCSSFAQPDVARRGTSSVAAPSEPGARLAGPSGDWRFGAVFDVAYTSRPLELGARTRGLELGHSDLTASGPLGRHFIAQANAALETDDGRLKAAVDELWLQTVTLPLGITARVGRFGSQIGYLNEQHPHTDDFVERPLLYRAFFGGHWNDDGIRVNVTLPTKLYAMVGVETFRGKRLVEDAGESPTPGAFTLVTKIGGDIGAEHSWQVGASYVRNRRLPTPEEPHGEEGEHHEHGEDEPHASEEAHAHGHHHGAAFSGRNIWMIDATWKWAPNGNNREQQVRLSLEAARITGVNRFATSRDRHDAVAISAVWRFHPNWEVGARTDWLRVAVPHDDHFDRGRLREHSLMVAWKPSHMQSLRLQYTAQRNAVEFENVVKNSVQLQYVIAFGGHGAHGF